MKISADGNALAQQRRDKDCASAETLLKSFSFLGIQFRLLLLGHVRESFSDQ